MAELKIKPRQKVRFAFWGAEEAGLLGSEHYVDNLTDDAAGKIYANLNFDMLGSPNYVRFVYDGDGSDTRSGRPPGSAQIEEIFNDYFASQGLATDPTAFDGRSDYGPFIAVGIPAGGLFSGAEGIKTAGAGGDLRRHRRRAVRPLLPPGVRHHQQPDTKALFELGDAAAHAVLTLARTKTGFFPDGSLRQRQVARSAPVADYKGHSAIR